MRDEKEPPARAVQSVVWVVARLCLRRRLGPLDCTGVLSGGKDELAGDGHGDEWTHLKPFLNRLETVFR